MSATGARLPAANDPLVKRFAASAARLWGGDGRLGLAVSGGPDSLALLLLSQAAFPDSFEVATVDHGLRAGSADECAMVARVCAERDIPCAVLKVSVAEGNVQARAREARYDALLGWAIERSIYAVATAHHADDQAETLLMRLNRGSGVSGLAGVREQTDIGNHIPTIIRPLLDFRRAELAEIVREAGFAPAYDPSNADDRFDRVRIRKALTDCDWLNPVAIAQSAANLALAEEAIQWCAHSEWNEQVAATPDEVRYCGWFDSFGHVRWVPSEVVLRVVERAVASFGGVARRSEIVRLIERLDAGDSGNLAGVLATVENKEWVFRREPPRR